MGNAIETPNDTNDLHSESNRNNHNEKENRTNKPGFFDSILCCGQDNHSNEYLGKNDFMKLEYYWFYQSDSQTKNSSQPNAPWIPYSIELNNIIEKAFNNKKDFCIFNFPENKFVEYIIDFKAMTQKEVKSKSFANGFGSSDEILKVRRIHKEEEKVIIRKNHLENNNMLTNLNFIREYNNTHNIQLPVRVSSFFKFLSFPIKCIEIFNQEIFMPSETISMLKHYFINYRINSFPHLKQLITQEISMEAEKLNNMINRNAFVFDNPANNEAKNLSNYLLQAEIYNDLIELNMNQDNLEAIIIYLFGLEGFIYERINDCLRNNNLEATNLKLLFILLQACICKQGQNDAYRFIKSNSLFNEEPNNKKHLRLFKGCHLDSDMIKKYLNMLKPLENKEIEDTKLTNSIAIEEDIIESETLFRRDDTAVINFPAPTGGSKKPPSIKSSLENILNDFKMQVRKSEIKENHFCVFNEFLPLTYDKNNALDNSTQNNAMCVFKFDSSLFSSLNSSQILHFVENLTLFGSERQVILSPFSVFKIDSIEAKTFGASRREIYEITFSFITNGNKKYDYLSFVNHMKFDLHSKNLSIEEIRSISNALSINNNVLALNLHGNKLGAESCKILGEGIKQSETLKLLSLSNCGIDTIGIEYLSEALKKSKKIQVVWLNNNNFGSKGAKYLMDMLKGNENIESIWLENNGIGYEGGIYISEVLGVNSTLKYIYLRNNELGQQGVQVISEAIKVNKTLEGIHLSYNSFGPLGAQYLSEALKKNLIIKEISINGNKIEKKGADCIAELLEVNKKIFVGKVDY